MSLAASSRVIGRGPRRNRWWLPCSYENFYKKDSRERATSARWILDGDSCLRRVCASILKHGALNIIELVAPADSNPCISHATFSLIVASSYEFPSIVCEARAQTHGTFARPGPI